MWSAGVNVCVYVRVFVCVCVCRQERCMRQYTKAVPFSTCVRACVCVCVCREGRGAQKASLADAARTHKGKKAG